VAFWNEKRDSELTDLWKAGHSGSEIARTMGTTRGAVLGRLFRLGLTGNRPLQQKRKGPAPGAFGLPVKKTRPAETITKASRLGAEPVPPPRPEDIPTKTFDELEWNDGCCRWRVDKEFRGRPYGFCGKETLTGLSFCGIHAPRAYSNWIEMAPRFEVAPAENVKEEETV
jgi:GcrA cell cycle regulator